MPRGTDSPADSPCCCPNDDIIAAIATLEVLLQQIEDNTDGLEGFVDGLEGFTDGVEALIAATNTALGGLQTTMTAISGFVDGLEGFVDGLETLIDTTNTTLSTISTTLTTISGAVDQLEGYLDGVEASLTTIATNTTVTPISFVTGTKNTSGSNQELIAAPGGGVSIYVVFIILQNETANAQTLILRDGSTDKIRVRAPNDGNGMAGPLGEKFIWKLTANTALNLLLSASFTVGYTIGYYTGA